MENNNMEKILQYINKNFVTVDDGDVKETNIILAKVLDEITTSIRSVSILFHHLFETYIYGGSFFDGLKVSKPDEFDIDLKLLLPKILDVQLEPTDRDGFVFVKLKEWNRLTSDTYLYAIFRDLDKLKDSENYLSQEKVKRWMQGVVQEAINKIKERGALDDIVLKYRMSGPAVTLNVTHRMYNMDIDLVAVFRMPAEKWPGHPVRQNTNRIWKDFLVVPKSPKDIIFNSERYWRLSFPEQEREMIRRLNYCKPALRLLKKLRDTRDHNIPSYFIKTVFLWEIEKREEAYDTAFWNTSLTTVFLEMLEIYKNCLEKKEIPYFWNKNNNFLQLVSPINILNIKNYLEGMIRTIHRNKDTDPFIIAKYLLPKCEFEQLQNNFCPKKVLVNKIASRAETIETNHSFLREPIAVPVNTSRPSQQTMEQTSGISSGAMVAGAAVVGIGAAIIGGLFAYARSSRNQNN